MKLARTIRLDESDAMYSSDQQMPVNGPSAVDSNSQTGTRANLLVNRDKRSLTAGCHLNHLVGRRLSPLPQSPPASMRY